MSNCIKIVNAMPQADQDALLTRLENYQAVGMTPKQAQLEAAKETLKRLEGEMPVVQQSQRSPLGFYSALSEGIESIATKQQPAGGWMAQIKGLMNKGAVKQDEVEWSGLVDWLALQEGKITKQQIADFLDANGVQVQETVLGAPEKSFDIYREGRGVWKGAYIMSYGTREDAQAWVDDHADEGDFVIEEQDDADSPTGTKYEQYTLPGGDNYREVLLTLPDRNEAARTKRFGEIADEMDVTKDRARYEELRNERTALAEQRGSQYTSAHWDQKNVLAHLRVDDRTDADGKRVLFVEEVQSDWGQDGKKNGFAGPDEYVVRNEMTGKEVARFQTEQEAKDRIEGKSALSYGKVKNTGLPLAPFVTKTDGWLNLALKRVITMAVQGGYDKVAFVNGEQSAERYSLGGQIDTLLFDPGDGKVIGRKNGGNVVTKSVNNTGELPDIVGKEITERLLASPKNGYGMHELSGVDLKLGGEGMKTFYNSIVPNATKALLKKLGGGQMEAVSMGRHHYVKEQANGWYVMRRHIKGAEVRIQYGGSKEKAEAIAAKLNAVDEKILPSQPGFTITPAMREKVSAGLPLFSKRDTEAAEAAGFDTSKVWYHGTSAKDFKSFRYGKDGVDELGPGIYFTSDPWYAEAWAGRSLQTGGRIIPAYLKQGDIFDLSVMRMAYSGVRSEQRSKVWEPLAQRILDRHDGNYAGWTDVNELADRIKDIGKQQMNEVLYLAGYVGAENKYSQIPGQVVVFNARNIRSPWAKFNPKKADSANILHSKRDQTDTEEFKTWSQGLDLVEAGEEYAGGPAVFTVYHGTTHSGITEFKREGLSEGFLGKGPYFTTDPEDASENYAGIGPDLTSRIEREKESLYDIDDPQSQADLLRDYFETEPGELPFYIKANEPGFNADNWEDSQDAIGMLWERFAEPAASWSATNAVKGDTDGLMMRAYVRMSNPADTTGNSPDLTYELTQDDDGNVTDENGTAVDWVMAAREVGERYGIGNSMEEHIDDVLSEGGDVSMKTVFDSVRKRLNEAYDDQGELLSAGAIFSEIAEEAGYDGVIMDAGLHFGPRKGFGGVKLLGMKGVKDGTLHMVPFSATQVKSATGNSGAFDPANPDIRKSIRSEASRFDDMVYKMQNKMVDTLRVVEAIKSTVGQIADDLNVYLQEELFHGRAAKRVADFGKEELKPLMEQIGRDGYTIADVEEYLQARHAPEANQVIAQRNPNDPGLQDGGSGMTNATAAAYMASLSATDAQKLAGIAAKVDAIIKQTRQLYVDYNLESQDTVDAWERMFQNYIPLQREDKEGRMGIGQGFSVKGKETKGRTGSTRKVVDVLANIALQREKLIVRGEKNRVATALVGLATANPDPDLWSVGPPPSTRVYDPKTNTVVDRVDPMYKSRDNVLVAKVPVNGVIKEMAVVFNETDPRALRMVTALKNLDAANLEGLLGVSAKITRYFSAVNTQYNPVFGVVNLIRDVQGAMINLGETPLAGQRARIAKDTMSALAGIYADMRAERNGTVGTSAWAQLFEEFELEGGQTGFRDLFKTSADRAEALQKILTPDAWMNSRLGKIFTANGKLKVPMSEARKGAGWIFDWLSDYNGAMENAVRLSAYKAAKDQGMSQQQAASLAKNLTVNFNRKGQAGQQAGALYAFFNAAMQGTARIGQTLFTMQPGKPKTIRLSSTGKKVVYGGILLGTVQALALAAAGFGDDDPPEFLRERALIIPVGGKHYVSIPMPLGFHVIPGVGRHAAEFALSGFEKPQKRIMSMIGMFMDAFNPIGNAGLSMQTVMPTALDPFAALLENKDWTGKPIARTSSNKAIPGHTQFKDTATAPAKWLAEAINWVTGGNDYVAGVMSPTPDQIDYLFGQVTGGVGRELSKVEQTVKSVVTGEELPTFKMPLVGRFFGNADSQASQASAFYDNVNKLNELETEVKGMQKDGKAAEAAELIRSRPDAYLIARANVAERQVQRLRREKRELIKKGAERSAIKAKEAQITETMKRLNAAMAQ